MTEFEAYKQFLGLKLHFTTDNYDVFRYKGVVKNLTEHSYETVIVRIRKDFLKT